MKFLKQNSGLNFHDLGVGNGFWDMTPTAKTMKEKKNKLASSK